MSQLSYQLQSRCIVLGVSSSIPEYNIHHDVSHSGSFRNSGHKSVREDLTFNEPNEIQSNLNREALTEPRKALENIRHKTSVG